MCSVGWAVFVERWTHIYIYIDWPTLSMSISHERGERSSNWSSVICYIHLYIYTYIKHWLDHKPQPKPQIFKIMILRRNIMYNFIRKMLAPDHTFIRSDTQSSFVMTTIVDLGFLCFVRYFATLCVCVCVCVCTFRPNQWRSFVRHNPHHPMMVGYPVAVVTVVLCRCNILSCHNAKSYMISLLCVVTAVKVMGCTPIASLKLNVP